MVNNLPISNQRILFATNEIGFGGGEKIFIDLVNEALALGITVTCIVPKDSLLSLKLSNQVVQLHSFDSIPNQDLYIANDFYSALKLRKVARTTKFICHGNWQFTAKMALFLRLYDVPVWFISTQVLASASKKVFGKKENYFLLRYGPTISNQNGKETQSVITRQQLGIRKEDYVALNISRFSAVKRLELFLDAVEASKTKALMLLASGFNTTDEITTKKIIEKKKNTSVIIVENQTPYKYMKCANIFISSSVSETLGVSILEAMSFGLPVICTATGGVQDFLRNGYNCVWIPNAGALDVAKTVELLRTDQNLAQRLIRGALVTSNTRSASVALKQLVEIPIF